MAARMPLLGGESSGSGGGGHFGSPRREFNRRSDAIAFGTTYQKAAALVDLAEDGVGLPEEILDQSDYENAARFYFLFIRFDLLWSINYFALIALSFFEKPLWCARYNESCNNRDYYFLGQLPYLTGAESLVYEGITLIILVLHTIFPISYEGLRLYWKNDVNKLKVISLFILVADLIVYILYLSPVAFYSLPFRIAPYIRVVFFILSIRELRDSIVILAGMLGTYLNVLALWLLFLLFSSWLAYVTFEDTEQGKTIFTSYIATLYQMFVLFTTSNNPDVWIPAYKASRWSCLFFVLYVLVGVYFVTNLILAVVYDSFKSQLVKQVSDKDNMRIRILGKAFDLIDENNRRYLDKDQCILLFEELNKYRSLPKISSDDFLLIFNELDDSHDFQINLDEFADLCNAIALRFQKEESLPWFEKFEIYHSPLCKSAKAFIKGPMFGNIIAFVLVLNLAAVVVETTLDIQNNSGQKFWQSIEFVFGWLYVLEMALKVFAYGFENYWRDGQNRFDFLITWVIVIGETATFASPQGLTFLSNGEWIRYLLIARMLRLIRLLMHVQRYRAFVATFLTLIPSLMPYLGTIFCILCMYCSLGVQFFGSAKPWGLFIYVISLCLSGFPVRKIFGGIVNAGNPRLSSTDLADSDYLLFNFNDYPSGMVTLFNLLVMGNWQVWMQSYAYLTRSVWTYAYFISFFLITVLLLLNLIVAFVLEAFFAEMDMESSEQCAEANGEDKGGKDKRRNVGTKTRSQRVDMLLHHMLSAELEQCAAPAPTPDPAP